jgi:hypothetical protein
MIVAAPKGTLVPVRTPSGGSRIAVTYRSTASNRRLAIWVGMIVAATQSAGSIATPELLARRSVLRDSSAAKKTGRSRSSRPYPHAIYCSNYGAYLDEKCAGCGRVVKEAGAAFCAGSGRQLAA